VKTIVYEEKPILKVYADVKRLISVTKRVRAVLRSGFSKKLPSFNSKIVDPYTSAEPHRFYAAPAQELYTNCS
jgi:hypothetical protein